MMLFIHLDLEAFHGDSKYSADFLVEWLRNNYGGGYTYCPRRYEGYVLAMSL